MHQPKYRDDNGGFLTVIQSQGYYNMDRAGVMKLAEEAGAVIRFGKRLRIDIEKCNEYLRRQYSD